MLSAYLAAFLEEGLRSSCTSQCASHQVFSIIQPSVETGKSFHMVWITHSIQKNLGIKALSFLWLAIFHSLLHHSLLIPFYILACFESCYKLVWKKKVILWKGKREIFGIIQIHGSKYLVLNTVNRCQLNVDMMPFKKGAP